MDSTLQEQWEDVKGFTDEYVFIFALFLFWLKKLKQEWEIKVGIK